MVKFYIWNADYIGYYRIYKISYNVKYKYVRQDKAKEHISTEILFLLLFGKNDTFLEVSQDFYSSIVCYEYYDYNLTPTQFYNSFYKKYE